MGLKDQLIQKLWGVLQGLITKYGNFIKKPASLIAVNVAANAIADRILAELKDYLQKNILAVISAGTDALLSKIFTDPANITDDQIEAYVKQNRDIQKILQYAGTSLNESVIGDITLACTDPDYYEDTLDQLASSLGIPDRELDGEDFINIATQSSDFDAKIAAFSNKVSSLASGVKGMLPWVFLVYTIALKMKEFLSQNEYPSKYRGKYLSRLIRIVSATLKTAAETNKDVISHTITEAQSSVNATKDRATDLINNLNSTLKSLDGAIAGILLAGLIYEFNRKTLQEKATETLNEQMSILCPQSQTERPSTINTALSQNVFNPISIEDIKGFSCLIPLDNYITPHQPIEDKIESFSCPIDQDTFASTALGNLAPLSSLSTKALYSNMGSTPWYTASNLRPGTALKPGDTLLTDRKGNYIYTEIGGTLASINQKKGEWIIEDIYEPAVSPLDETIQKMSSLYQELSNTKEFLKNWYTHTILPTILAASPMSDASISSAEYAKIVYWKGGTEKRYEKTEKDHKGIRESYEKKAKKITGKDRVEEEAKNETLYKIKDDLDALEQLYYKQLYNLGTRATNQGKQTLTKKSEFSLFEYYIELYDELLIAHDQSTTEEYSINTPNEEKQAVKDTVLSGFTTGINDILLKRYFIDGYSFKKITEKINELSQELDKGYSKTQGDKRSYYELMVAGAGSETGQTGQKTPEELHSFLSSYVSQLGKKVSSLSTQEKNRLKFRIITLFKFSQTVATLEVKEYTTEETPFEATRREANYISSYMATLFQGLTKVPEKIDATMEVLDEIGQSSIVPSTIYRDDEEYLFYGIGTRDCPAPEVEDEMLSPFSKYEFKDIQYWLKYCAYATLSSVLATPANWGTGLPPPIGPTPLPTVYIPIKAFQLAWGILVIGITITGIYPFPWIMIANLSTEHHVPLVDPATILRKSADVVKKSITEQLKEFKNSVIQKALDREKDNIEYLTGEIERIDSALAQLRANKPKRNREEEAFGDKVKAMATYTNELAVYEQTNLALIEEKSTAKVRLFSAETKWSMLKSAQNGASKVKAIDPITTAIQKTEEGIDKAFAKLDAIIAKIDPFVAALPVATKPFTANFGFTLKNPKPIQKMAEDLDQTVNTGLLAKITQPFELDKEDLMSTDYGSKLDKSVVNGKLYLNTLAASSILLIPIDPFPKYERLKPTNLAWTVKFLLPNWGPVGGGQYGFPGFHKYPI
jgi:hypothetical protein